MATALRPLEADKLLYLDRPSGSAVERGGNNLTGCKDLLSENSLSSGQNLALTGLCVPNLLNRRTLNTSVLQAELRGEGGLVRKKQSSVPRWTTQKGTRGGAEKPLSRKPQSKTAKVGTMTTLEHDCILFWRPTERQILKGKSFNLDFLVMKFTAQHDLY